MDRIESLTVFVKAAETLSFVATGRALGLTASAVGKSIARLESDLGTRLFHRSTRRVSLTAEGELFYERARAILEALADARAMLSQATRAPHGRLRVSLPTIGYRFLGPHLPEFKSLYPEVEFELDFNDRVVDVIAEGFDAVIRSGDLTASGLISRRLGPFRFLLCAAPAYLDRRGTPLTPADLGPHERLRYRLPTTGKLQPWGALEAGTVSAGARASLTCNNMEALYGAAIEGLGLAYMPDFLAREALAAGQLRSVLGSYARDEGQFSVLWPSSRQLSAKVRVFVDFVTKRLFT